MKEMARIWEKALTFLGLVEETEEEEIVAETSYSRSQPRKGNVVNLHNGKNNLRLIITRPREFSETQQIVEHIKAKKPVLVNLEDTDKGEAVRIIDFLAGATFAMDGNMQKVSQQIFVFAPPQVQVNADSRRETEVRGINNLYEE